MNRKAAGTSLLLLAAVMIIFTAGCVGSAQEPAKINDTVNVYYTLTLEDGTVYESNVGDTPLNFVIGSNDLLKGFNDAVIGMLPGETKTIYLAPGSGYVYDNESVYAIQIEALKNSTNETIEPGLQLIMIDALNRRPWLCEVVVVDEESGLAGILVNHPLVNAPLTFTITLDSIEQNTQ